MGVFFFLDEALISAGGRTQSVIPQSPCEAKCVAATTAISDVKYKNALFTDCVQQMNFHLRPHEPDSGQAALGWIPRFCSIEFYRTTVHREIPFDCFLTCSWVPFVSSDEWFD